MLRIKTRALHIPNRFFFHWTIHLAPSIMYNYLTTIVMNQGDDVLTKKKVRPKPFIHLVVHLLNVAKRSETNKDLL